MAYKYDHIALGGTFDLLHKGHVSLLEKAFYCSKFVSIGITTDKFCNQSGKTPFENQTQRKKNLLLYLKSKNWAKRAKIIWLDDIYGITTKDKTLEAIVVSKETVAGAREINKKRLKNKLKKLTVIVSREVLSDDGKRITSGRIRAGEISQAGLDYLNLLLKIAGRRFPQRLRAKFKKPFGKLIKIDKKLKSEKNLVAVGDISVSELLKIGILPDISIVDFLVNRKTTFENLGQIGFPSANPDVIVENVPGQISKKLIEALDNALKQNHSSVILVDGEEDLATIPAVLLAPLGSTVIYGQPAKGAVLVRVETAIKEDLCYILGI
ncbi:pantetheine-phosphate adenylyltransferase [Candidatus Curtissbacteria bacterium]|nr:pantetheine-phosphate adenylyltransferase [Candidatus Curtissbacteria bacterium]